jgi:uncharacterized membrane protein YfcA
VWGAVIEAFVVATVFVAALLQSLSGFGFAIVVMPLLTLVLGVQMAAPIVAMAGLTVYAINLVRYRQAIDLGELLRLASASILGALAGLWVLVNVSESVVERLLGLVLMGYALYSWMQPAALRPLSRQWVYPAGFLAGCLGGAYNTPGPPVVVYGSLRQWPKDEFRAMLQSLFLVNAVVVVASHLVARHVTGQVFRLYLYALPALMLGILAGARVDHRLDQKRFHMLMAAMILVLGFSLVLGAGR